MEDFKTNLQPKITQLNFLVDSITEEFEGGDIHLRTLGNYAAHLRDRADEVYKMIEKKLNKPIQVSEKKVLTGKIINIRQLEEEINS